MFGSAKGAAARNDHAACSGCSLCLLVCPVWRSTHDPRMTPEGRAKALQSGASPGEIAASVQSCTLCGACEPVCPEEIDLVGMTLDLRARIAGGTAARALQSKMEAKATDPDTSSRASVVFLPGPAMRAQPEATARIVALLGGALCADDGADIAEAIVSGVPVPAARLGSFLGHLRGARTIVVEDGLWIRHLRAWLPMARPSGLGESLSSLAVVRRGLRKTDLYVIESRAYHGDYERLVKHYDRLRAERGCAFNLDLQRVAIPATGQAGWILKGLKVDRIVVERLEDAAAFEGHGGYPVVHVAELADH